MKNVKIYEEFVNEGETPESKNFGIYNDKYNNGMNGLREVINKKDRKTEKEFNKLWDELENLLADFEYEYLSESKSLKNNFKI